MTAQASTLIQQSKAVMVAKQEAEEGEFTTDGNYAFNCFSDKWVLGYHPSKRIDVSFLHCVPLSMQIDVRLGFASVCKRVSAPRTYMSILESFLRHSKGSLTHADLNSYVAFVRKNYSSDQYLTYLKMLLEAFSLVDIKYLTFYEYLKQVKLRKKQRKYFDPDIGALSDGENEAIALALNAKSCLLFHIDNTANLLELRRFIALRLIHATARRPINLAQLKWCDLSVEPHPVDNNYHLKIPMAKLGDAAPFRTAFEDMPFPILPEFYRELTTYRDRYCNALLEHLQTQGIILSIAEQKDVLTKLPMLFHGDLLVAKFTTKAVFLTSINESSEAFHCDAGIVGQCSISEFKLLNTPSDRVMKLKYSPNRQRHTIGTRLGVKGAHKTVIAAALGHSDLSSAKEYVDMTVDMMRAINATVEGMETLQNVFEGRLIDDIPAEVIHIQTYQAESGLTDMGSGQTDCRQCDRERPLHCYGCPNFRPLKTADHRIMYDEALCRYDQNIKLGVSEADLASLRNAIKSVAITIKACDAVLARPITLQGGV